MGLFRPTRWTEVWTAAPWLVVVAVSLAVPATTIFRRDLGWTCLNVGAFAALGAYVGWSYLRPTRLPRRLRAALVAALACCAGALVLTRHELRHVSVLGGRLSVQTLAWATYLPASALGCFLAAALGKDVVLLAAGAVRPAWRRGHAPRRAAMVAAVAAALLLGHGLHEALRVPRVVAVDVPIAGLPPELEGFRIVQLSDLHIGQSLGARTVRRVAAVVNTLDADVVAITGDLVDHRPSSAAPKLVALRSVRSRHGVFFVTGNHEHGWGAPAWIRELRRLGMVVMTNDGRTLDVGGAELALLGVLDPSARAGRDGDVSDLAAAARSAARAAGPRVLLAHQADAELLERAEALGIDLVLSGHTHGGQVFPGHLLAARMQPWGPGLHRIGRTWSYTSRGTGFWGPMLRIGAPSEITLLRLRDAGGGAALESPRGEPALGELLLPRPCAGAGPGLEGRWPPAVASTPG